MPQLDISTFTPQLVWLAILFVLLYLLMAVIGLPRVRAILEARRQRREDDLVRAAQMKAEAEAAAAAYQQLLAEARAEAQTTLRQASERLAAEAAERQRKLAAALAGQVEAAERRIADSKTAALAEIRGIALEVGQAVVEKLTGGPSAPAALAAAVDTTLSERGG